ncbi:hypothetical protein [Gilvimarinus xylanilyticus]|uniref:Uncharacterized protein n=1 Tax=Gilvimarinus xylanilyticus TaxID=2944139 RepID=A0A9X2KT68_9GAMM|nr:hypothetical protein [Gilvimarinus xylanilyticus]MCP8898468.1 hypothetical protein [Gilvimarinus xylanilyticus]
MSLMFANTLALSCCLMSAVVFYLGCPNQQWLAKRPTGFWPALLTSLVLLIPAWWLFHQNISAISASFALLTTQMLCLGLLPFMTRFAKAPDTIKAGKSGVSKHADSASYKPHWWLRTLGCVLLVFPLAVGLSGLLAWWGPGDVTHDVKSQMVMWMITPLWFLSFSLIFFVRKLSRAFVVLLALNALVYSLLWLARSGA